MSLMDEMLGDEPDKPKKRSEVEILQRKLDALDEERRRRLKPATNLRSGRADVSKPDMEDLNARMADLRKQLAKARAAEATTRRDLAKP